MQQTACRFYLIGQAIRGRDSTGGDDPNSP